MYVTGKARAWLQRVCAEEIPGLGFHSVAGSPEVRCRRDRALYFQVGSRPAVQVAVGSIPNHATTNDVRSKVKKITSAVADH